MYKLVNLLLLAVLLVAISACSAGDKESTAEIGFLVSSLDNPFFAGLGESAEREADRRHVRIDMLDSANDLDLEKTNMQACIDQGVKVIIFNPVDSVYSHEAMMLAVEAEIPVITIDRDVDGGLAESFVSSDNVGGGQMAGELMVEMLGNQGDLMILEGILGTSANTLRLQGFNDALIDSSVEVVAQASGEFDRLKAKEAVEKVLDQYPEIDGILACNDEMALGAADVLVESGKKVIVIGFDGTDSAVEAVFSGHIAGTIGQKPDRMVEEALSAALAVASGEEVASEILVELEAIVITK